MRMQGVFTSLLVTGALSESSVKQYEELCHTKDGTIEEISPSYKVLYKCGQVGNHNGEPVTSIATAKACAELCKATLGCTGSSWASKQKSCVLSGSRKGTAREYTLYMENVVGSDHFHKGEEDPFSKGSSETGSCEGLIEKFAAKLNECKCKNTNNSGGSTGGNSDRRCKSLASYTDTSLWCSFILLQGCSGGQKNGT
jgi:hypothetical protein